MRETHSEHGQSLTLIALGLAALMAFMALAVDAGNVYAQRRQVQNAVDAASLAGSKRLADPDPTTNGRATNGAVWNEVRKYAENNGLQSGQYVAYYVERNSDNSLAIDKTLTVPGYGTTLAVAPTTVAGKPVVGVYVTATKTFNSFFAPIIGFTTMTVGAPGVSYGAPIIKDSPVGATPAVTANGTCCADNLYPIALNVTTFTDLNGDGLKDVYFEQNNPTYNYYLAESTVPSNGFTYLVWSGQTNNGSTVDSDMRNTSQSGLAYVGDYETASSATMGGTGAIATDWVNQIYSTSNQYITFPLYDTTNISGQVHIAGFVRFKVTAVCRYGAGNSHGAPCDNPITLPTTPSYIQGKFEEWSTTKCAGACPNYGITTTTDAPPPSTVRSLSGVLKIQQLFPSQTPQRVPIDVVHLLDTSGSMDYCISTTNSCANTSTSQKLYIAKQALLTFNGVLSSTVGDQVGLATFPQTQSTSSYSVAACTQNGSYNILMTGQNRNHLTTTYSTVNTTINSLSANSGTPLAGGLLVAQGMANDPNYHVSSHPKALIVASDGLANVVINGQWTGFSGSTYSAPACNSQAVQDAVTQANTAKGSGIQVFSIAIGTDFNSSLLQAVANSPANTHFFTATDYNSMLGIYNSIATALQNGSCYAVPKEIFGSGVTVTVTNTGTGTTYTTTTTSGGYFQFTNIPAGTYQFSSVSVSINGVTYNIYTDGVGGPTLTTNPSVVVGSGNGTYEQNLSLGTSQNVCSGG